MQADGNARDDMAVYSTHNYAGSFDATDSKAYCANFSRVANVLEPQRLRSGVFV